MKRIRAVQWGVFDTVENIWWGDDSGPKLFPTKIMARVSAQITDVQMGYEPCRTVAKRFRPQPVRLRDSVDPLMSSLKALRGIEEGRYL